MMNSNNNFKRRQAGLTLIELIISMTIGLVLVLGVATIFNTSKRSFVLQNGLSSISETARFSVDTLNWHTRMAGFRDVEWARGRVDNALTITDGGAAGSDSISVTYAAAFDCNRTAAVDGFVTIQFGIVPVEVPVDPLNPSNNALACNNQILFENVVDMQIFVGEDTDNDGIVNRFRVQDGTIASNRIKVLNINLLIRTDDNSLSDTAPTFVNNFWSIAPVNDGRLYQEYSFNIAVRNLI